MLRTPRPQPHGRGRSPLRPAPLDATRDDWDGRDIRDSPGRLGCPRRPVYSHLSLTLQLYMAIPVRAAEDCRPYRWTPHGPPFYILYIFYAVNYPLRVFCVSLQAAFCAFSGLLHIFRLSFASSLSANCPQPTPKPQLTFPTVQLTGHSWTVGVQLVCLCVLVQLDSRVTVGVLVCRGTVGQ